MERAKVTVTRDPRNKGRPHIVRWFGDIDNNTGKRRRHSQSFRIKREAEQFAAKLRVEGKSPDRGDVTLGQFCKDYLQARKSEIRPATYDLYKYTAERLVDYFGDCKLRSITPQQAAVFVAEQSNIKTGEALSAASRKHLIVNCKVLFNAAVGWELLPRSPFKSIKRKKLTQRRWYRMMADEYLALLDAAPELRVRVAYALFYTAGLRLHEAFNLTWTDIDFDGYIVVRSREGTKDTPPFSVKDHESRQIPVPVHTIDLLTELQAQAPEAVPYILLTAERYEKVKARWQRLRGQWRNRWVVNNTLRNFKGHVKRAGIKPVDKLTLHVLRKNAGQNWSDSGLPVNVVKELMGHADVATTMEFYSQVGEYHLRQAAAAIDQLLSEKSTFKVRMGQK